MIYIILSEALLAVYARMQDSPQTGEILKLQLYIHMYLHSVKTAISL